MKKMISTLLALMMIMSLAACGGVNGALKEEITAQVTNVINSNQQKQFNKESSDFVKYNIEDVSFEIQDVEKSGNKYVVTIKFVATTSSSLSSTEKSLVCYSMKELFDDFSFDYNGKTIQVTTLGSKSTTDPSYFHVSAWVNEEEVMPIELPTKTTTEKHKCAICGKTEGTRQITAQAGNGKWDENWYCQKHYADAWQYYYGDKK